MTDFLPPSLQPDNIEIPRQVRECLELLGQAQAFAKAEMLAAEEISDARLILDFYGEKIRVEN